MIPATTENAVARVEALEEKILEMPQIEIGTDHVLHAGTYARTITMPPGVVLTGAFIKVDTTLIVSGDITVFVGDEPFDFFGYNGLPTMAGRKTAFLSHTECHLTMTFATDAKTVEEAEVEFTNEVDKLGSRKTGSVNTLLILGG